MEKELKIICVVPKSLCFQWEVEILCQNFRENYLSGKLQILYEKDLEYEYQFWDQLQERYTEVQFFGYSTDSIKALITLYPPIIRPNILKQHWLQFPDLQDKCIMYIDSDIIISEENIEYFNRSIKDLIDDDINYCSKTPYIGAKYFQSKEKDVLFYKRNEYKIRNILSECCKIVGIDPQVVIDNEENTGGCQWFLKNIDYDFWEKVEKDCIQLNIHLRNVNSLFFIDENHGFQTWAISDMGALLWNIWLKGGITSCPRVLNFSWATTPIEEWDENSIYHNAGTSSIFQVLNGVKEKMFYKGDIRFRCNVYTPFDIDEYTNISDKYCGYNYLQYILNIENPICKVKNHLKY